MEEFTHGKKVELDKTERVFLKKLDNAEMPMLVVEKKLADLKTLCSLYIKHSQLQKEYLEKLGVHSPELDALDAHEEDYIKDQEKMRKLYASSMLGLVKVEEDLASVLEMNKDARELQIQRKIQEDAKTFKYTEDVELDQKIETSEQEISYFKDVMDLTERSS